MSLRAKLALVLASLAALAAVGVGWFSYSATSDRMLSEIDTTLRSSVRIDQGGDRDNPPAGSYPPFTAPGGMGGDGRPYGIDQNVYQGIDATGTRLFGTRGITLPIDGRDREIASSGEGVHLTTAVGSDGHEFRVFTRASNRLGTIQIGRDLSEMNRILHDLRTRILLVGAIAVAVAAIAGWLFARGLTTSLRRLTVAAGEVSTTGRLDIDVSASGRDEVGRLGAAFSTMLGALNRSREEQQRLVQDAGHELRTPLTSLRTNVDVLRRHADLAPEVRARVLDDLHTEVGELSSLVEEVVAVGSGRSSDEVPRPFHLADAVTAAADRVSRRTGRTITTDCDDVVVVAQRALLERAITNLIDNAAKFDPSSEPIEVDARHGRVAVRDHGPGVDGRDLPFVFDRFFRSVDARSQPGSGLGLSIVSEVATAHGGSTFAENHPGGGAVVGIQLPVGAV